MKKQKRPKLRHIAAAVIIVSSIAATSWAIKSAEASRGYVATSGEYLLSLLELLVGWLVALVSKDLETLFGRREEESEVHAGSKDKY